MRDRAALVWGDTHKNIRAPSDFGFILSDKGEESVKRRGDYNAPPSTFVPVGPGLPPAGSMVTPNAG